jgi:hypothetical protein
LTDTPPRPNFPVMHPVTRVGRVIQQLRSFGELHAGELETMASDLEAVGATDVAARLRLYRDMQRDEASMVVDELVDIQAELATNEPAPPPAPRPPLGAERGFDPAANSPKRAKWLAEQAAEAERLKQPFSRRDLFGGR